MRGFYAFWCLWQINNIHENNGTFHVLGQLNYHDRTKRDDKWKKISNKENHVSLNQSWEFFEIVPPSIYICIWMAINLENSTSFNSFLTFEYTVQHMDRMRQINHTTNMMRVVPNFPDCNDGFSGWQMAKYLIFIDNRGY